ncbi:MAG TPA: hypothetical protein VF493_23660 [Terriglobales bacterium]
MPQQNTLSADQVVQLLRLCLEIETVKRRRAAFPLLAAVAVCALMGWQIWEDYRHMRVAEARRDCVFAGIERIADGKPYGDSCFPPAKP